MRAAALHDEGSAFLNGLCEVSAAIESVHAMGERIAAGRSAAVAGRTVQPGIERSRVRPCITSSGFANIEAERGVERKGTIMEGGLDEADTGGAALAGRVRVTASISLRPTPLFCVSGSTVMGPTPWMIERSSRQLLPRIWPLAFGDDAVDAGSGEHALMMPTGDFGMRESRRESCAPR